MTATEIITEIKATGKYYTEQHDNKFGFCRKSSHTWYWFEVSHLGATFALHTYSQNTGRTFAGIRAKMKMYRTICKILKIEKMP